MRRTVSALLAAGTIALSALPALAHHKPQHDKWDYHRWRMAEISLSLSVAVREVPRPAPAPVSPPAPAPAPAPAPQYRPSLAQRMNAWERHVHATVGDARLLARMRAGLLGDRTIVTLAHMARQSGRSLDEVYRLWHAYPRLDRLAAYLGVSLGTAEDAMRAEWRAIYDTP